MYEFMQKNVTRPELQTIDEMIEQGYDFYMEWDFKNKFPESEISKKYFNFQIFFAVIILGLIC